MSKLLKIYERFRQMFQPYYRLRPNTKKLKRKQEKQMKAAEAKRQKGVEKNKKLEKAKAKQQQKQNQNHQTEQATPQASDEAVHQDDKTEAPLAQDVKEAETAKAPVQQAQPATQTQSASGKTAVDKVPAADQSAASVQKPKKKNITITEALTSLTGERLVIPVLTYPKPLDNVMKFKNKPKLGQIWTYHDNDRHQAIGHFGPKSSHSAPPSMRSDERRAQLKPWVKPTKMKTAYDRTHIIPFGFHGSESDPRLVVGWLQRDNRNKFKVFENKHRDYNIPIFWFVDIRRIKSGGAQWTYRIYDARTLKLIDELTTMASPVFQWKKVDE